MLIVYPNGDLNSDNARYIRPTPLISISQNTIRNKLTKLGSTYDITLNGTIVSSRPLLYDPSSWPVDDRNIPIPTGHSLQEKLPEILSRQAELRTWFATNNAVYIEVLDIEGNTPRLSFYGKVQSINFEEGTYVDIARYSISLTADYLLDSTGAVLADAIPLNSGICDDAGVMPSQINTVLEFLNSGLVEDFNDTWSIEADEANGQYINNKFIPRSYKVSRNMTATGRDVFPRVKYAWEHARDFLKRYVEPSGTPGFGSRLEDVLSSGMMGFGANTPYRGYNHVRTENFDKGAGSYSVSDTWLVASGDTALENYTMSINNGIDSPFIKVSIDGNIKGLSDTSASGYLTTQNYGLGWSTPVQVSPPTPYDMAYQKFMKISNSGQYGIGCDIFKRANNTVAQQLNSQPNTVTIGVNETNGEITYSLEFNNRPTNYFTGVLYESVNINDTYPGDVFATIPVIGRPTGPVLQYIGGRTEYKRDVNIEIKLDHTDLGYNNDRNSLMLTKPSVNEPIRSQLSALIQDVSPSKEPGIRKYFLNPPSESWSPKEGTYTLSLSWVYELNK